MPNILLRYDDARMRGNLSAAQRLSPSAVMEAHKDVATRCSNGEQGWMEILDDQKHLTAIKNAIKNFGKYKACLVLGIGGSDLGARAALAGLRIKQTKTKLYFAGDTTDPEELEAVLDAVPWKQTCINVISKSGGTLETMTAFFAAKDRLDKAVGAKNAASRIVCTTDPEKGDLHALAVKNGYAILPVPQNIGGRFSVLTSVGLFPLGLAGSNVSRLIEGARNMRDQWLAASGTSHDIDRFAAWHVAHDKSKRQIHTLMVYASALEPFGRWWRQIWAESLGKEVRRDGRKNYDGPTPVVFLGPTDQHSQLQLYQDGPDDKVYTFMSSEKMRSKIKVPSAAKKFGPTEQVSGKSFVDLLKAETDGTAEALVDAGRPVGKLVFDRIDEQSLGEAFMFFEIATAVAGALYGVNAFDQPGVEASKVRVKKLLAGPDPSQNVQDVI